MHLSRNCVQRDQRHANGRKKRVVESWSDTGKFVASLLVKFY
jgi:hypothetical protein